jgi:hypothetical protein
VSDDVIQDLKKLRRLQRLNVKGTRITQKGIQMLKRALPKAELIY